MKDTSTIPVTNSDLREGNFVVVVLLASGSSHSRNGVAYLNPEDYKLYKEYRKDGSQKK